MPHSLRVIWTSILLFLVLGPIIPVVEVMLITLVTKGRIEINPAFYLAAIVFGALIAAALGFGHGLLVSLAVRTASMRQWLRTPARRIVLGAGAALLCGLLMAAATLYLARNSYGSLLGAMDPNNPDPWQIIRAYMVFELFIIPALVCGVLFQVLPWSRNVMLRAIGHT
jgi:hypothetical protein